MRAECGFSPIATFPAASPLRGIFSIHRRFFKENFGAITESGYNVDSFGHNGMLPQLLRKAGMKNYVYLRPSRDAEKKDLPESSLHYWNGPDGSSVTAFHILDGYGDDLRDERVARYENQDHSQMLFYGIGNHGGGPAKEHLKQAEKLHRKGQLRLFRC